MTVREIITKLSELPDWDAEFYILNGKKSMIISSEQCSIAKLTNEKIVRGICKWS